ncbi:hypothetical protein WT55_28000 [Burkholderia pseudomultivorans]|nr:hypothetical protein WT55_28000 [Burkholderia pseudomultivorans]
MDDLLNQFTYIRLAPLSGEDQGVVQYPTVYAGHVYIACATFEESTNVIAKMFRGCGSIIALTL